MTITSLTNLISEHVRKEKILSEKALNTNLRVLKNKVSKALDKIDLNSFDYYYKPPIALKLLCIRLAQRAAERKQIIQYLIDTLKPENNSNEFIFDNRDKNSFFTNNWKNLNCTNKDKLIKYVLYNIDKYLEELPVDKKETDYLQYLPLFKNNTIESLIFIYHQDSVSDSVRQEYLNNLNLNKNIYMEEREGTIALYHFVIFYALGENVLLELLHRDIPYKGQKRTIKDKVTIIKQCIAHMKRDIDWNEEEIESFKIHLEKEILNKNIQNKRSKKAISKI